MDNVLVVMQKHPKNLNYFNLLSIYFLNNFFKNKQNSHYLNFIKKSKLLSKKKYTIFQKNTYNFLSTYLKIIKKSYYKFKLVKLNCLKKRVLFFFPFKIIFFKRKFQFLKKKLNRKKFKKFFFTLYKKKFFEFYTKKILIKQPLKFDFLLKTQKNYENNLLLKYSASPFSYVYFKSSGANVFVTLTDQRGNAFLIILVGFLKMYDALNKEIFRINASFRSITFI